MAHSISDISPNLAAVGDSVTITGTGFGAAQGGSAVDFNGTAVASYTSWSATSLVVVVPAGATSGRVGITISGSSLSAGSDDFRYVKIRDTTVTLATIKAQDTANDSASRSLLVADAGDWNELIDFLANTVPAPSLNEFRLTLTSGTPVTTSDVTGATTVYLTPCNGDRIAVYNGRGWDVLTSAEVSLALGTLTNGANYDVFAYNSSGTLTLEFSAAWASDTARTDAITQQNGVWVKTSDKTRRLVGTIRTTSTTQTEDSAAKRFVGNVSNREPRTLHYETGSSDHNYTTIAWRAWNNDSANRVQFVLPLAGLVSVVVRGNIVPNANGVVANITAGLDTTTADSFATTAVGADRNGTTTSGGGGTIFAAVGYHYVSLNEIVFNATGSHFDFGAIAGQVLA